MKIDTTRIALAKQMAGAIPAGAEVVGLIVNSDDSRNYSALVRMRTGMYISQIAQMQRSIDQRRVSASLAASALGSIRSERKAAAAKENGRKGGRPIGAKDKQPRKRRKKIVDTLSR